jgi:hypothetical protein
MSVAPAILGIAERHRGGQRMTDAAAILATAARHPAAGSG